MPRGVFQALSGRRFHRLDVVARGANIGKAPGWQCRCDCGSTPLVRGQELTTGRVKSCGCLQRDRMITHGKSSTPTWKSWAGMRRRCEKPGDENWAIYGGRGIAVCERWRSFENFLADMVERPSGLSIDRIDNDGNYEPGNCRWATDTQQGRNTSANRLIEHGGRTMPLVAWADECGLEAGTIYRRLKLGWSTARALSTPLMRHGTR